MRKNLNITQIDDWEKNYNHVYIKDECIKQYPKIDSFSDDQKKYIYDKIAQSEGLKSISKHEWYFENGYMINIPKRTWRELYSDLTVNNKETETKEATEKKNCTAELAERLRKDYKAVLYYRELEITKQENWKHNYKHVYIADKRKKYIETKRDEYIEKNKKKLYPNYDELPNEKQRFIDKKMLEKAKKKQPNYNERSISSRRYIDKKLAIDNGLEKNDNYEMHHEKGYMINVPKKEHKKEPHIGEIGLSNHLKKLKKLKDPEKEKQGYTNIYHFGSAVDRKELEKKTSKETPKKTPKKTI